MLFINFFAVFGQKADTTKPAKMKQYFLVLLKKGENRTQDSITAAKIQEGHMAHINKMHEDGFLALAGPCGGTDYLRGIFVLNVATKEDAENLCKQDPAVKSGRLSYEIHPWWSMPGTSLP